MAAMAESRMNLWALQQRDPYITGIVDTASQVALYSFNPQANEWEKTDVEGTLFVYTRSASPVNGFLILNRLGLNDLIEPLNKNLEFQLQDPFLLYRNNTASIYGIWFYDKDECARIGQLMNSLVQIAIDSTTENKDSDRRERRASESEIPLEPKVRRSGPSKTRQQGQRVNVSLEIDPVPEAGATGGAAAGTQGKNVNILDMLTKAKDQYDKGEQRRSPAVAAASQESAVANPPGNLPPNANIMDILARARHDHEQAAGGTQKRQSPAGKGFNKTSRNSPKAKGKGKAVKHKGPKPLIDNPNASATKSTNILRPLAVKPRSSPDDLEDPTATPSTSITLDALFKSTQDDKPDNKSVSPQPPAMGMPPLLQRLMSQPGSSMLEDIERQSLPQPSSAAAEASSNPHPNNGASVPKMPSPPKVVNAKWSHEPESPNTVIKRSLNMLGGGGDKVLGGGSQWEGFKADDGGQSKHSLYRTASMPAQQSNMAASGNERSSPQDTLFQRMHFKDSHPDPNTGHPLNVEMLKLRNMVISDERDSSKTDSASVSGNGAVHKRTRTKPDLALTTTSIAEEQKPELMTPQALMEKAAFPVLAKSTSLASSQIGTDSVLLTPSAFETSRGTTPPANTVQLPDNSRAQRNSFSGDSGDQASPSSRPFPEKPDVSEHSVSVLTKQQLQQALVHLVKNDSSFMTAIHDAYVQSLHQELRVKSERL